MQFEKMKCKLKQKMKCTLKKKEVQFEKIKCNLKNMKCNLKEMKCDLNKMKCQIVFVMFSYYLKQKIWKQNLENNSIVSEYQSYLNRIQLLDSQKWILKLENYFLNFALKELFCFQIFCFR